MPERSPEHPAWTILLVDDEGPLRRAMRRSLRSLPLTILEAESGIHALEVADGQPIHILISDLNMPRMNGVDLAWRLREERPALKLIFTSGAVEAPLSQLPPGAVFLHKPFLPDELIQTIQHLLDR